MSTSSAPLNTQPDPTQTGSQPNPLSTPKSGFWGILKNRVLPQIGPALDRLGAMFGSPAVRAGSEAGLNYDTQQQELQRQQQFDIPALQEARNKANISTATMPNVISEAQSRATAAGKTTAMTPGDLATLQQQEETKATAPITGLMKLSQQAQSAPASVPPQIPPGLQPGSPLVNSGNVPVPVANAAPSSPLNTIPPPQEILAGKIAQLTGKPVADKEPTKNPDGSWTIKMRNPYTLGIVGEQGANAPASQLPNKTLIPYLPAGVNPNAAKQEDWAKAADAYNTRETSHTGIQMVPQPDGSVVPVPVTSSSTTTRGAAPSAQSVTPKPALTPRGAAVGAPGSAVGGKVPPQVAKAYDDYNGALTRQDVMNKSLPEALAGNQQAMINILANHLGMTAGIQKGSRINQAMWNEAMTSTPWISSVLARFGHTDQASGDFVIDGPLSGVTIPPEALKQMVSLAGDRVNAQKAQWQREIATAKTGYGMGTPASAGTGGAAAAGPKWNPKTARFE